MGPVWREGLQAIVLAKEKYFGAAVFY